jgi:hypothetical protein
MFGCLIWNSVCLTIRGAVAVLCSYSWVALAVTKEMNEQQQQHFCFTDLCHRLQIYVTVTLRLSVGEITLGNLLIVSADIVVVIVV